MRFNGSLLPAEEAGMLPAPADAPSNGRSSDGRSSDERSSVAPTSLAERALLFAIIISLPLQDSIALLDRFSVPTLLMAAATLHLIINRPWALKAVWRDPVFLASYALLYVGGLLESLHPEARIDDLWRIGEMVVGAVVIAALCRDERALRTAVVGFLIGSVCLSVLIFLTSYTTLSGAVAVGFNEASLVRQEAFEANPLQANLNTMAFGAAQGAVLALACFLTSTGAVRRALYLAISALCLAGAFLPESRSGIIIAVIACAAVMAAYRSRNKLLTVFLVALALGGAVLYVVPPAVYSRLSFSTEEVHGKQEARARVYTASLDNIPEYIAFGVGAGNYWSDWGKTHGFETSGGTLGAHNCFFQVAIYWGFAGVAMILLIIRNAYRCLPVAVDDLTLCLRGLAASLLLYMFVTHMLYSKEFSLGLGLLVGSRRWIWPPRAVFGARREALR